MMIRAILASGVSFVALACALPAEARPIHGAAPAAAYVPTLTALTIDYSGTDAGYGGSSLGSTTGAITSISLASGTQTCQPNDLIVDGNGRAVPNNTARSWDGKTSASYGAMSSTYNYNGYCLATVSNGIDTVIDKITFQGPTIHHITGLNNTPYNSDTTTGASNQLTLSLQVAQTDLTGRNIRLGDTIYLRPGIANQIDPLATSPISVSPGVRPTTGSYCYNLFWGDRSGGCNGTIYVTSEVQNTSTAPGAPVDAMGNPVGGTAYIGPVRFSNYSVGDVPDPINFNHLSFYSNTSSAPVYFYFYSTSSNANGVSFSYNDVQLGPAVTNASGVGGFDSSYSGAQTGTGTGKNYNDPSVFRVNNNHFKNLAEAIVSSTNGLSGGVNIQQNKIEQMLGDGIDLAMDHTYIDSNLILNPQSCCGAHADAIQIDVSHAGTGPYTDGTITRNIMARANPTAGSSIGTVTILNQGTGYYGGGSGTFNLAVPAGGHGNGAALEVIVSNGAITNIYSNNTAVGADQGGHNYIVGDVVTGFPGFVGTGSTGETSVPNFNTGSGFSAQVTSLQGIGDMQCIFDNNIVIGGYTSDQMQGWVVQNNLCNVSFTNGITLGGQPGIGPISPNITLNTAVKEFQGNSGTGPAGSANNTSSGVTVLGALNGSGGAALDRNIANAYTISYTDPTSHVVTYQGGTITCYPGSPSGALLTACDRNAANPVAMQLTVGDYSNWFNGFSTANPSNTDQSSRAANILMFAPVRGGYAYNADGTYSGWLFPADNAGVISFNDGTVFDPTATHTPAY
jgi:hypothetical protein